MDVRTAAIGILTKALESGDTEAVLAECLAQIPNMDDRLMLAEVINLVKGKYAGRDYTPGSADDANNARRKSTNVAGGSSTGISAMPHVKPYAGKAGKVIGVDAIAADTKKAKKLSAKNPTHKRCPKTGVVLDVLHSSGAKKGKSVFSDDAQREATVKQINAAEAAKKVKP